MRARMTWLLIASVVNFEAAGSPDIEHWSLDNGARVYFVGTHQLPMVQFSVGYDAGSARDPDSLQGLARFVSEMIEEGAAEMDGAAIAETFDSVGAEFSSGSGRDMSVFELRSLSDATILTSAVHVFATLLKDPTFPVDSMERIRDRMLLGLKHRQQSPGSVTSLAFYRELFDSHPYSTPPAGEAGGIAAIRRADLISFFRRYYVGENAVITIVGDLTRAQAHSWAERMVGQLPTGSSPPAIVAPRQMETARVVDISFPSSQTHLMFGQVGIARNDADYFPLYVGNYILGGSGLISRLSDEIREKRGLAYSAYSYFVPMLQEGPFIINLQTRNDQRFVAEEVVLSVLNDFVQQGPTAEELEAAKKNISGGFPLRIDSNKKIASNLLTIAFYDLPLDYLDTFSEKTNSVTIDQITQAFQRRVFPDQLLRVFVGNE